MKNIRFIYRLCCPVIHKLNAPASASYVSSSIRYRKRVLTGLITGLKGIEIYNFPRNKTKYRKIRQAKVVDNKNTYKFSPDKFFVTPGIFGEKSSLRKNLMAAKRISWYFRFVFRLLIYNY